MSTTTKVATRATVSTRDFARELKWAGRFAEKQNTLQILRNVAITATDGLLQIIGTDLEVAGITKLAAETAEPFSIAVNAALAVKYLEKVSDDTVRLQAHSDSGNMTLRVVHGEDSVFTLAGMDIENYPEIPCPQENLITISGLAEALPRAEIAISGDESRFTLNGALLDIDAEGARLISTDGHRLSLVEVTTYGTDALTALIPRRALHEAAMLKADSLQCTFDQNHMAMLAPGRVIVARKLTGQFPDWRRVLPKGTLTATIDAQGLRKHGERVALAADERSHTMCFRLAGNVLTISCESDGKSASAKVATTWDGPEWMTGLNWEYVQDFLKLIPKRVAFDLKFEPYGTYEDENGKSVTDTSNKVALSMNVPGWQYVVMPMRM